MSPPIYTPDGTEVSEIVLPDGSTASQVIGPDGNVVFEAAPDIPDSVVSLYEFEDDTDTSTAIDSEGSNDLSISGATYTSTAAVGSLALSHDGSDDLATSQNTIDLSAAGDTDGIAISTYHRFESVGAGSAEYASGWAVDNNNFLMIFNTGGDLGSFFQVGGSNDIITGPSLSAGTLYYIYAEVLGDGTHNLYVDSADTVTATSDSGLDPANIGSGNHITGGRIDNSNNANVIVDDFAPCVDPLSDSERQTMIDRAN